MQCTKKWVSFCLALIMLAGIGFSTGFTADAQEEGAPGLSVADEVLDSAYTLVVEDTASESGLLRAGFENKYGQALDPAKDAPAEPSSTQTLPAQFDLREQNRVSAVRDQGTEGQCWAFACDAALESNILSNSELQVDLTDVIGENALTFAPAHTSWFAFTSPADEQSGTYGDYIYDPQKGSGGGFSYWFASAIAGGSGLQLEANAPYENWKYGFSEAERDVSYYHLDAFNLLNRVSEEERIIVKSWVYEDGAVNVSYYSDPSLYYVTGEAETQTAYYQDERSDINHSVAIVGWDDDFSKENFDPNCIPPGNGAWLIKNSWGEGMFDQGYFWLSYYDPSLQDFSQFQAETADSWDYNYQYDGVGGNSLLAVEEAANIFTAQSDQLLNQVGFWTAENEVDYQLSVYLLNDGYQTPREGRRLLLQSGNIDLPGYHTVDLEQPLAILQGQRFSVVLSLKNAAGENALMTMEGEFGDSRYVFSSREGESFIYVQSTTGILYWQDTHALSGYGNVCIKAMAKETDEQIDKGGLAQLIQTAKNIQTDNLPQDIKEQLARQLVQAENVLHNESAPRYLVENAKKMLQSVFESIDAIDLSISSADDFAALAAAVQTLNFRARNVYLTDDIVFNTPDMFTYDENGNILSAKSGAQRIAVLGASGAFCANFDGQGHTISGFYTEGFNRAGIFSEIQDATVKNLTVKDSLIIGSGACGGIAGILWGDSSIDNCHVENVTVRSASEEGDFVINTGGLVGSASASGVIRDCSVKNACIQGNESVGGFSGSVDIDGLQNCTIQDSLITGSNYVGLWSGLPTADEPDNSLVWVEAVGESRLSITLDTQRQQAYVQNLSDQMLLELTSQQADITYDNEKERYVFSVPKQSVILTPVFEEHSFESTEIAATCDSDAYTLYTCKNCGYQYREEKPYTALVHTWEPWQIVQEATLEEEGLKTRVCSDCGEVQEKTMPVVAYIMGDTDGDNVVTTKDVLLLQKYIANFAQLEDDRLLAADIDGNGRANIQDVLYIQQYLAHMLNSLQELPSIYMEKENWAYVNDGRAKKADVFFVTPTVYMGRDGGMNMSLQDEATKESFLGAINMERGIYAEDCRFFAPYYRQASIKAYEIDYSDAQPYLDIAYKDVKEAFDFYMENYNDGRPVVLAGFSQGADMVLRLTKDYYNSEGAYGDVLVASYVIGWRVTQEDLDEAPYMSMAYSAEDIGSIISFNTEDPSVTQSVIVPEDVYSYSINPLSWSTDTQPVSQDQNEGACFTDYSGAITKEIPAFTGAYIDPVRGTLKVTDVDPQEYPPGLDIFESGVYHLYDYQFFYRNLQENVGQRVESFITIHSGGAVG